MGVKYTKVNQCREYTIAKLLHGLFQYGPANLCDLADWYMSYLVTNSRDVFISRRGSCG